MTRSTPTFIEKIKAQDAAYAPRCASCRSARFHAASRVLPDCAGCKRAAERLAWVRDWMRGRGMLLMALLPPLLAGCHATEEVGVEVSTLAASVKVYYRHADTNATHGGTNDAAE